ncbi:uncharacterized protein LOC116257501 isoform X1 [Nymphaea colorata]|uniref:uncharacterized protein LOC116257501 isoform X1 n=1 Tax=Nymphaea colorata TaxID=210225 RepID=UPI00214F2CD8|nr:uncharacterized protein LOC116257501 isoform X1 [Nymphaea colorata]
MRSPLEGNPKTDILFNFLFFLLCCFLQGRVLHGTKAVGDLTGDDLQLPLHRKFPQQWYQSHTYRIPGRVLYGTKAIGDLTGDDLQLPLHSMTEAGPATAYMSHACGSAGPE